MKRLSLTITSLTTVCLALLCAVSTAAQFTSPPEYGVISELRGKRTIYVFSADYEARIAIVNSIEEAIRKKEIDAELVGAPQAAEIWVTYVSSDVKIAPKKVERRGEILVTVRGQPVPATKNAPGVIRYRRRLVYSTQSFRTYTNGITFQRSAHKKAIGRFLSDFSRLQREQSKN